MSSNKPDLKSVADCVSLLMVFAFLLLFFTPELMLSSTTTTGGDMGSHFAPAHYLKNYLLPHGKLIGWYPHWMAGTPMFQFYFVPPYLLMSVLSSIMSLEVAFKLVTVLGIFLLPFASYFCMRAMGFRFPAPAIAAGFATLLLFNETYSQWGGNIPSTLAGEFSYILSFSLTILLIGTLYMGIERNRYVVPNAVLLALVVLTHIYTGIFITAAALFFLLVGGRSRNLAYLFKVFFLAGLISGFWTIPLLAKIGFSAAPKDVFYGFPSLDRFINPKFTLFYFLAAASVGVGIKNKDRRIMYLLWAIFSLTVLILFIKYVNLLYIRFTPLIYFIPLLMAAETLGQVSRNLKARWLLPLIVVLFTLIWVNYGVSGVISEVGTSMGFKDAGLWFTKADSRVTELTGVGFSNFVSTGVTYIPSWIKWNYEGLEAKEGYETFMELNDYLRQGNLSGRVDFEYSDTYNRFGTPRLFEVSPVFSDRSVMESLLLESSLTFPFFYYMQREMSQTAWWPGFPIEMPSFDPDSGLESLRIYNVQYFVAVSEKTKEVLDEKEGFRLLKEMGEFRIYAVNEDSQYVEVPEREPVLVVTDDWKTFCYDWFSSGHRDVPLVFTPYPSEYDLSNFRIIVLDKPVILEDGGRQIFYPEEMEAALNSSPSIEVGCSVEEKLTEEEIRIKTDCIGRPLLVKVSYFPNWRVEGAEKVYMASPSIMLIIPEREEVRLYYGETLADQVGNISSILGIVIVFYWLLTRNRRFREGIHLRLLGFMGYERVNGFIEESKSRFRDWIEVVILRAEKNWKILLLAVVLLIILSGAFVYLNERRACDVFCRSRGFSHGEKYLRSEVIDHFDLGFAHVGDNKKHDLICTAACDESRDDMVYVSGGFVEFDMSIVQGEDNTLILTMWDNANCRSGDLYINERFATRVVGNGKFNWKDFEFKIDKKYADSSKIRVRLEHVDRECYGWDVSDAYIRVPDCICY
ncbi:MAG: hypothetical protein JW778_07605 [Candidatus Altiarchaeota archaeon]|nr:hypothetical protein [Candidatus Altiarchaeota archaeon]